MDAKTTALLKQVLKEKANVSTEGARTSMSETEKELWNIFEERPVPLTEFIQSKDYLDLGEDFTLSEIQYDFVRHMEQILFQDTYSKMQEVWGDYWKTERRVNNLVAAWGKGSVAPYEKVYDAKTGAYTRLDEISDTDVFSITPGGRFKQCKIAIDPFQEGYGSMYRVKTSHGVSLDVWEGHKFYAERDRYGKVAPRWKPLNELKVLDRVAVARRLPEPSNPKEIPQWHVELLAYLFLSVDILSDTRAERGTIALPASRQYLVDNARDVLKNLGEVEEKLVNHTRHSFIYFTCKDTKAIDDFMEQYGIKDMTVDTIHIPEIIFQLKTDQVTTFVSRIFDARANVSGTPTKPITFHLILNNSRTAEEVQRITPRLGFLGYISYNKAWTTVVLQGREAKAFIDVADLHDSAEKVEEKLKKAKQPERGSFEFGDSVWSKITSIEYLGEGPYWSMTVDGLHNYVANGFINKNSGKNQTIVIAFARIAYLLLCLREPQKYYRLASNSFIHMMNVALSATQAKSAFFKPMRELFVSAPWFEDKFAEDTPPGPQATVIRLKKRIELISGHSQADSQEGHNLIAAVADEIAGFPTVPTSGSEKAPMKTADGILKMLKTSALTRFPETYKLAQISFTRKQGDPIMQALAEADEDFKVHGDASTYYKSGPYSTWEVNPNYRRNFEFIDIPQSEQQVPNLPEILNDYRKKPEFSRGYYECRPEASENAYFKDKAKVQESFSKELSEPPLLVSYYFGRDDTDPNEKYSSWQVHYTFSDDLRPIPGAVYAIHADMAIKEDRAGIAMCHVENYKEIESSDVHGEELVEMRPVVKMDFATAFEYDAAAVDPDGNSVPREIQMRWYRKLVHELTRRGFEIGSVSMDGFQCLSGDTKIPLLDGTTPTIAELVSRDEPFYLYSIDTQTGEVVPGKATKAFYSGAEDVYAVTLDNGSVVEATAGHPFMLRDGSFKPLSELSVGQSLMPLYTRDKKTSPSSAFYQQVWHPGLEGTSWKVGKRRWQFTHSMVNSYFNGPVPKGSLTHHIDWTKKNNDPSNLVTMTWEDHAYVHSNHVGLPKAAERFRYLFDNDPEWRKAHINKISKSVSEANKKRVGKPQKRSQHISIELIGETVKRLFAEGESYSSKAVSVELGCTRDVILHRVRHFTDCEGRWSRYLDLLGIPSKGNTRSKYDAPNNHKVVSVEYVGNRKTYDISVEQYHNFAIDAGIFVHNSADSLQIMQTWGLNAHRVSADIITTPVWQTLRDLVYDGRFHGYKHKLLIQEMLGVEKTSRGKIDHTSNGSKDILDAVACSATMAVECGGSEEEDEDIEGMDAFGGSAFSNEFSIYGSGFDGFSDRSYF